MNPCRVIARCSRKVRIGHQLGESIRVSDGAIIRSQVCRPGGRRMVRWSLVLASVERGEGCAWLGAGVLRPCSLRRRGANGANGELAPGL